MAIELVMLGIIVLALTLYAVLGGADFGAGVWEFNTALQSSPEERGLIYRAIGPVWEANHVWLIFVIVAMFSAFPPAFAGICRALWLPLLLALVGIVFRGAAYAFRVQLIDSRGQEALWNAVFALASTAAPFFLGASLGAVASGKLAISPAGEFSGDFLTGWISPLSIFNGFFTVGMCAYLTAVFLTREAAVEGNAALAALWRKRALGVGVWMGVLALAGLAFVAVDAASLWDGFRQRAWPLVSVSVIAGFLSLYSLWREWFHIAAIAAGAAVSTVVWGWAAAQYPLLLPPDVSIEMAKGPPTVLHVMAWSIVLGFVLLLPALGWLFYLFKSSQVRERSED